MGKDRLTLSPQSLAYAKQEGPASRFSIGIESGGSGQAPSIRSSAAVAFDSTLLGGYFRAKRNDSEIGANAVIDFQPFFLQGSMGYQFGRKEYDFFSGRTGVDVSQRSGLIGIGLATQFDFLQAVSVRGWGTQARQRELLAPLTVVKETASSIDTYLDQRLLSEGRLTGWSLGAQGLLIEGLTYRASLGSERLLHPYSDGTSNLYRKSYHDLALDYRLAGDARLGLTFRDGVTGKRYGIRLGQPKWHLFLENDQSAAYGLQTWRVGITLNLGDSFAQRTDTVGRTQWSLLSEAAEIDRKPREFPSAYLLKVDPTAVKLLSSVIKGTINWNVGGSLGEFNDTGTPNRSSISIQLQASATNANPVAYALHSGALPPGVNLSSTGLIAGAASAVAADTVYRFRIKAQSLGAPDFITPELTITVKAPLANRNSFSDSFGITQFSEFSISGQTRYYFTHIDATGRYLQISPDDHELIFGAFTDGYTKMHFYDEGNYFKAEIDGRVNGIETIHFFKNGQPFATVKNQRVSPTDIAAQILGKTLTIHGGCRSGANAVIQFDLAGNWTSSCAEQGRFLASTENCPTRNAGTRYKMDNVGCFINETRKQVLMVALKAGSLASGGELFIIGNGSSAYAESWTFTFSVP